MATSILFLLTIIASLWLFYWCARVEKNPDDSLGKFLLHRDSLNAKILTKKKNRVKYYLIESFYIKFDLIYFQLSTRSTF